MMNGLPNPKFKKKIWMVFEISGINVATVRAENSYND